jgi:hypothetical protein
MTLIDDISRMSKDIQQLKQETIGEDDKTISIVQSMDIVSGTDAITGKYRGIGSVYVLDHPANSILTGSASPVMVGSLVNYIGSSVGFSKNTGSYGVCPNTNSISFSSSLSVDMWLMINSNTGAIMVPLFKGSSDGEENYGMYVFSGTSNTYSMQFNVRTSAGECVLSGSPAGGFVTGTWYHLVGAYASGTSIACHKFYCNGTIIGSRAPMGTPTANTGSLWFSTEKLLYGRECHCSLEEIRLWNKALDTGSVTLMYNGGSGWYGASGDNALCAGWHFDEGSGTIAYDFCRSGNDVTLVRPTWGAGKVGYTLGSIYASGGYYVDNDLVLAGSADGDWTSGGFVVV